MKKNIVILIITLLTTISAMAANTSNVARKTLDKASAKIGLTKGVSANFTISGGKLGKQSGVIAVKGNKFNARTNSAIIWFDGKTQWLYNKKNDEVNISTPSPSQQHSMNPYSVLTLYKNGYTMSQTNTASGYQVHLTGQKKSISEMYILIDKQYNIKQVKIKQGQQWVTITISGFTHKSFSDADFRFKAKDYPKAEIIDLR